GSYPLSVGRLVQGPEQRRIQRVRIVAQAELAVLIDIRRPVGQHDWQALRDPNLLGATAIDAADDVLALLREDHLQQGENPLDAHATGTESPWRLLEQALARGVVQVHREGIGEA